MYCNSFSFPLHPRCRERQCTTVKNAAWRTPSMAMPPSYPSNTILLTLFGIALIIHTSQGVYFRTWGILVAFPLGPTAVWACNRNLLGLHRAHISHNHRLLPTLILLPHSTKIHPTMWSSPITFPLTHHPALDCHCGGLFILLPFLFLGFLGSAHLSDPPY